MPYVDFISSIHKKTSRDYVGRVTESPKAEAAKVAKQFGEDYWDGDRKYGYGGYSYDGRWEVVAKQMIEHYGLTSESRILDIGCGKAFLLYEFTKLLPGIEVAGVDISEYGLKNAKEEIRDKLTLANATKLPFEDKSFDYVYSINTFHNLFANELDAALREMARVTREHSYICVESYRNEEEKANLLYWQLTCESFYTPEEWQWWFEQTGYRGDFSFIYFE